MADKKLVKLVHLNEELYNASHPQYKNLLQRKKLWEEISNVLIDDYPDLTANACKKRWKNIRDKYFKRKRYEQVKSSSGGGYRPHEWPLQKFLTFLENTTANDLTDSTFTLDESAVDLYVECEPQPGTSTLNDVLSCESPISASESPVNLSSSSSSSEMPNRKAARRQVERDLHQNPSSIGDMAKDLIAYLKDRASNATPAHSTENTADWHFFQSLMPIMAKLGDADRLQLHGRIHAVVCQFMSEMSGDIKSIDC